MRIPQKIQQHHCFPSVFFWSPSAPAFPASAKWGLSPSPKTLRLRDTVSLGDTGHTGDTSIIVIDGDTFMYTSGKHYQLITHQINHAVMCQNQQPTNVETPVDEMCDGHFVLGHPSFLNSPTQMPHQLLSSFRCTIWGHSREHLSRLTNGTSHQRFLRPLRMAPQAASIASPQRKQTMPENGRVRQPTHRRYVTNM